MPAPLACRRFVIESYDDSVKTNGAMSFSQLRDGQEVPSEWLEDCDADDSEAIQQSPLS
jgi:hypothetical protein